MAAALDLVQGDGLQALTMRRLADLLDVKAASLYWHVRDRGEVVELLAQSLLAELRVAPTRGGWRAEALAICAALENVAARRRDASRLFLEVPETVERSDLHQRLQRALEAGGLAAGQAAEAATMMLIHVLVRATQAGPAAAPGDRDRVASLAVDSGSRGVTLRAGPAMAGLVQAGQDPTAPAPAVIRGDTVIVRRLRGGRQGELELNPARPWQFKVQGPTWNTVLNLVGIDVRGIHIDSSATRVECILPAPSGVVPIEVSGGTLGVHLRRPIGVPVVAELYPGSLRLKLDDFTIAATTGESNWESAAGAREGAHYLLRIKGGAVRVTLEEDPSLEPTPHYALGPASPATGSAGALALVLDGIASRSSAP